jgi:hypothetical protein
MYSNDLNNAYTYETQRRLDEIAEAANCRLAAECAGEGGKTSNFSKHLPSLLAALVMFFAKRWA